MYHSIRPGQVWLDENGNRIQAHGGYIRKEGDTYYWYGENKEKTFGKDRMWTYGIKYYSSKDLYNWKDEGFLIEPSYDKNDPMFYEKRIERPHILKNEKTNKYVCYIKYGDVGTYCIYTADRFEGPYTLQKRDFQVEGKKCGDYDFAFDENGHPYLFCETDHRDLISVRLSDDYIGAEGEVVYHYKGITPPYTREGVTCFKKDGKYYLLTSGMIGYVPNPSEVAVADRIQGPYRILGDPHVDEPGVSSYNSQISCIFRYDDQLIALADRWVPNFKVDAKTYDILSRAIASRFDKKVKATFKEKLFMMKTPMIRRVDNSISDYVMLPVEFEGDRPVIHFKQEWKTNE